MKRSALMLLSVFFMLSITLFMTACGKQNATETSQPQSQTDSGSIKHTLTKTDAKFASCTENGNIDYWYCSICDKYFSDEDAQTEISLEDTVIKATGHTFSEEWTYDEIYHYHASTCSHTDEVSCKEEHIFNENICSVCKFQKVDSSSAKYFTFTLLNDDTYSVKVKSKENLPTEIIVPDSYEGKPVTSIGSAGFFSCRELTSVEIPSSVTTIGSNAFQWCSELTSVTFGENSQLTSIGMAAFV